MFDRPDGARDTIRPGAFTRTLAEREGRFPLYWQHRPERRIGWVEMAGEDGRGLRIIASIDNPDGRAATLLRRRAVSGLSFGYRARAYRHTPQGRELAEIDLFEVSVVTHPLQHGARVHFLSAPSSAGGLFRGLRLPSLPRPSGPPAAGATGCTSSEDEPADAGSKHQESTLRKGTSDGRNYA